MGRSKSVYCIHGSQYRYIAVGKLVQFGSAVYQEKCVLAAHVESEWRTFSRSALFDTVFHHNKQQTIVEGSHRLSSLKATQRFHGGAR